MAFTRWVRARSQDELLTAAQARVARRAGLPVRAPHGLEIFWQKVYAPVYHRLPAGLRDRVIQTMPGSHRQVWHRPAQPTGPAAVLRTAWRVDPAQPVPAPAPAAPPT